MGPNGKKACSIVPLLEYLQTLASSGSLISQQGQYLMTSMGGNPIILHHLKPVEPRNKKTGFLHMRKQIRRSASRVTAKLISAFVFATRIV